MNSEGAVTTYSYAEALKNAYAVNWRIEDVLEDRAFDTKHRWLPPALSATRMLAGLDEEDRRRLTQIEMAAYAHLFGYVEEFIAPKMVTLARDHELQAGDAFDALTNFAAEEVKHMTLFREVRRRVDQALGFETALVGGEKETARFVLSKSTGAMLLLTAAIEWFTQIHYRDAMHDDEALDSLTRRVFRAHWQEEAQHAKLDHMETLRAFAPMTPEEKDRAPARPGARAAAARRGRPRDPARQALDLHRERRDPPALPGAVPCGHHPRTAGARGEGARADSRRR
jgi:hypothetical protein